MLCVRPRAHLHKEAAVTDLMLRHQLAVARRRDPRLARKLSPDPPGGLVGFDEAVRLAGPRVQEAAVTTRWSSASVPGAPSDPLPTDPEWSGGSLYRDVREAVVGIPPERVWRAMDAIGGGGGRRPASPGPAAAPLAGSLTRLAGIGCRHS